MRRPAVSPINLVPWLLVFCFALAPQDVLAQEPDDQEATTQPSSPEGMEPTQPAEPPRPAAPQAPAPEEPAVSPPPVMAEAVPAKKEASWTDKLTVGAFADAYYAINFNFPKPQTSTLRVFDPATGFALSWAGVNVSYAAEPVGATIALRFGPTAELYSLGDTLLGFDNIKEAFVTWRPLSILTLDFGRFATIYGAEVAESWQNINYTRGFLNGWGQPFHHTGLRAGIDITESFKATILAVNGWDNAVDNNDMKSFGVQFGYTADMGSVIVGYLFGPEQEGNNDNFRHFVDLIATLKPTDRFTLLFNADFIAEDDAVEAGESAMFFGASLAAQLKLTELFALGARVEYLHDRDNARFAFAPDGDDETPTSAADAAKHVVTGTLTLDITPSEFMLIRLDVRGDFASEDVFQDEEVAFDRPYQVTSTLGAVVYTN